MTCRLVGVKRGPPFIRAFIAMCASGDLLSSIATGVGHNPLAIPSSVGRTLPPDLWHHPASFARIVGHNPNAVSSVLGSDGDSRNNKRPAGVADSFQVRKHTVEAHRDEASNILSKHPSRSDRLDSSKHRRPEVTVICLAFSLPGQTERLAGETPGNERCSAIG
jgi:hypothetical protein